MNLCWYIIGDGIDMTKLKTMIKENNLDDYIKVLGSKNNPLPYVKKMDLFFCHHAMRANQWQSQNL